MRTILFRGKHIRSGHWYRGFYCVTRDTTYCFTSDYERNPVPEHHNILVDEMTDWGLPNRPTLYEVDPKTVGQYTGIKDVDGKKIFEGDILNVSPDKEKPMFAVVRYGKFRNVNDSRDYENGNVGFFLEHIGEAAHSWRVDILYFAAKCKVVGNVYDNPEMIDLSAG